ncbi:hypothetical protein LA080_004349 [Diaporthe eres]|uniref:Uncharacterized protein n=1 Tax=Diaporthe vaccinii TaxID=105482 RepID=A0ABR4E722_9PEZI|nr:hypothetical protein LA080_004349 [Diaporthe eres]
MESTHSMSLFGSEEQNGEAMEPLKKPVVHFFQATRFYDGGIQHDSEAYHSEEGVWSVSPLSGGRVSTEAVIAVHPNKVPVRVNSMLPSNDRSPSLVFEAGTPHVMVDTDNDLICHSSFGDDWYPDDTFAGGNACRQEPLGDCTRRLGLGLPPLTRGSKVVRCQDCRQIVDEAPFKLAWESAAPDYCVVCVCNWVCYFPKVEQVFLIVPGLPKAEPGDEVLVYRFGEGELVEDILKATEYSDRVKHFPRSLPGLEGDAEVTSLVGVETTENFGSDGHSRSFEGNGITLYEARAGDIDDCGDQPAYQSFLQTVFTEFGASRRCVSEQGQGIFDYESGLEGFPAYPPRGTAKIAGGVIEFRVLTYQLHDGHE